MHLACRQCSTRLTTDLQLVPFIERNETMGEAFLCPGTVMQEDGSYFHGKAGNFIAHIDDTLRLKLTTDSSRLNGCCGLDGCDGPNLQCEVCDTYVATKMTDCWMPHCIVFDPNTTQAAEGGDQ
jgi:RNA polymerase subunit RPABC4/transcription elongation factor Spt4